jgi:AcrR family transcriptional regulator
MNEANVRDTKDRILDSAERLFAVQGLEATSLRQITTQAKVNLAAVNYHFQSKDELVRSVYLRRIRPMNTMRLCLLDALEAAEQNEASSLEGLLEAFFEPVVDMALSLKNEGFTAGQLMGRMYTETHTVMQNLICIEMGEVARRFGTAFGRALPHLAQVEVLWRLHFTIGVLAHTLAAQEKIAELSQNRINPRNKQEVLRQMMTYAKAGLLAPSLESKP